jgi:hypothetical protein
MRGVNQFIKPIYFKMEGSLILEQLLMKNNFVISYNLKEAYNHVLVHPTMQDTISMSIIQIPKDAFWPEQHPESIHSNNEKSDSCYHRNLESLLCDISRRLTDLTSRPKLIERDHSPDNPIPSTSGLDCQFRKVEPNPIKSIQIPGLDVEYLGHVSAPSRREKIEYPSRIEEIDEKNKIQKMYSLPS